jgi:hypothetical protein
VCAWRSAFVRVAEGYTLVDDVVPSGLGANLRGRAYRSILGCLCSAENIITLSFIPVSSLRVTPPRAEP